MRHGEKRSGQRFARLVILLIVVASFSGASIAGAFPAQPRVHPLGIESATAAQIRKIAAETAAIRSLDYSWAIQPTFMARDELRSDLVEDFADYTLEEQDADERFLRAFRLVPDDFDLRQLYLDRYTSGIGGYYNFETDQLVVIGDNEELNASERSVLSHELGHALQDHAFDLEAFYTRYVESTTDDAELAATALFEGDAEVVQSEYMRAHPELSAQIRELFRRAGDGDDDGYSLPPYFEGLMWFPYGAGLNFIRYLLHHGGWDTVNTAYADPPTTTEQVLHPDRYLVRDHPQSVTRPNLLPSLGDGWQLKTENDFGELQIGLMLAIVNDPDLAQAAPIGWDGDRYALWSNGDDDVIVWESVWDSIADAREFATAIELYDESWFGASFQGLGNGWRTVVSRYATSAIEQTGNRVRYVFSQSSALAQIAMTEFDRSAPPPVHVDRSAPSLDSSDFAQKTTACEVQPRSVESIQALLVLSTGFTGSTSDLSVGKEASTVRRATEEERAAIARTVLEQAACENAGEWLRAFALRTDDELRRYWAWYWPPTPSEVASLAVPAEPAFARFARRVVSVHDVNLLSDGRIGALVDSVDPWLVWNGAPSFSVYMVFVQVGDRWLIDESYALY